MITFLFFFYPALYNWWMFGSDGGKMGGGRRDCRKDGRVSDLIHVRRMGSVSVVAG